MTHKRPPQRIDEVRPGFYRYRRVRGGPWLPAVVTVEDGMIYVVEADERLQVGIEASAYEDLIVGSVMEGRAFESALVRVIWFGTPIKEAEYKAMLDLIVWARQMQPDHPILHPDEPIRLREVRVSSIF